MIEQMAPRDAQMYWMSDKIPNDQFLLFCFAAPHADPGGVRDFVVARAAGIGDLRIRAHDVPGHLDYPYWVPRDESHVPVVVHALVDPGWPRCRQAVADLLTTAVDVGECPWRLHLFPGVEGAPGADGRALVAVLQISHALADGRRASAAARALFGPDELPGDSLPRAPVHDIARGVAGLPARFARLTGAARAGYRGYREQQRLVAASQMEAEPPGFPLTSVNCRPDERRSVRMIVLPRDRLRAPGVSVTVAVLAAIGDALPRYLRDHGQCPSGRIGAELTVAEPGEPLTRNHFRNLGIDLGVDEPDLGLRAAGIAECIQRRRLRAAHPAIAAQRAGGAFLPAWLMWAGVRAFSADVMPPTVAGNTVVSSVARGAADLCLAGGRVLFTAGFPALSPAMGLTHGVHGIGDTVTVSMHTSVAVVPDADHYEHLLAAALERVAESLDRLTYR